MTIPGTEIGPPKPGDQLLSRFRLSHREQAVVLAVLLSPTPLTAWQVAQRTKMAYSHAKATVRSLAAERFLTRKPDGLYFQPDPAQWGSPRDPTPR
jgi:hypothetical protein